MSPPSWLVFMCRHHGIPMMLQSPPAYVRDGLVMARRKKGDVARGPLLAEVHGFYRDASAELWRLRTAWEVLRS